MEGHSSEEFVENTDAPFESDTDDDIINKILKCNDSESENSNLDYINDISNFPSESKTANASVPLDPIVLLDSTDQDEIDRLQYINNLSNFGNDKDDASDVTRKFIDLALILGNNKSDVSIIESNTILQTFFQEETGPDALYRACYKMNKICSTLMKNPAVAHYDLFSDSLICNKPGKRMPAPSLKKLTQPLASKIQAHPVSNLLIDYNQNKVQWLTDCQGLTKRPLSNRRQRPLRFVKKNFNAVESLEY
jgi:hypothetical protein